MTKRKRKCMCIKGITEKRAAKHGVFPIIDCPKHGVCTVPACGCIGRPHP